MTEDVRDRDAGGGPRGVPWVEPGWGWDAISVALRRGTRRFSKREMLIGGGRRDAGETRAAEDPAGGGYAGGV